MSIFGSSSLPLMLAGQREVQRPHSVQLYVSKRSFHVNSVISPTPNVSAFSRSTVRNRPFGSSVAKNTLSGAASTCRCFEYGSQTRKPRRHAACSHHAAWKIAATAPWGRPASVPATA